MGARGLVNECGVPEENNSRCIPRRRSKSEQDLRTGRGSSEGWRSRDNVAQHLGRLSLNFRCFGIFFPCPGRKRRVDIFSNSESQAQMVVLL